MEKFADNVFLYQFFFFQCLGALFSVAAFVFLRRPFKKKGMGRRGGGYSFSVLAWCEKHFLNALNLHREIEECLNIIVS